MELILKRKLEDVEIKPIEFNYEELDTAITVSLQKYKNIVYTEESIKQAKEDRALLNKVSKALNNNRLEIQKHYETPIKEFKSKIDSLINKIQGVNNEIDKQIKEYEEERERVKKEQLLEIISALFIEHNISTHNLDVDLFFEEDFLNATFSIEKVKKAVLEKINVYKANLGLIENEMYPQNAKDKEYEKALYLDLLKKNPFKIINVFMLAKEEIKKHENLQKTAKEILRENNCSNETTITLQLTGTIQQLKLLKDFLSEQKIKFKNI